MKHRLSVLISVLASLPAMAETPRHESPTLNLGQSPKKHGIARPKPKSMQGKRLGLSVLDIVCPPKVTIRAREKIAGMTHKTFEAQFHSVTHTRADKYDEGHYRCTCAFKTTGSAKKVPVPYENTL